MHVLRAEKGYIIVGQDTDGTVTPHDAGLLGGRQEEDRFRRHSRAGPPGSRRRGPQAACRPADQGRQDRARGRRADRRRSEPASADDDDRWVSSSYWSENCGRRSRWRWSRTGFNLMGKTLYVPMPDRTIEVTEVRRLNGVLRQGRRPCRSRLSMARSGSSGGAQVSEGRSFGSNWMMVCQLATSAGFLAFSISMVTT
jgi:hypothetical protein